MGALDDSEAMFCQVCFEPSDVRDIEALWCDLWDGCELHLWENWLHTVGANRILARDVGEIFFYK